MARIHLFLLKIGINPDKLRFRQHLKNEMAHYASDCWDAEIQNSFGWIECVGCADRSAYDLSRHGERTNEKLVARDRLKEPKIVDKVVLELDKKKFGPTFKKDAKTVENYLMSLKDEDLLRLREDFKNSDKKSLEINGVLFSLDKSLLEIKNITEKVFVDEYVPNVIEPSFGIGRILYCLVEHSWWVRDGDENRNVLSFPVCVSPTKCLVLPLSNSDQFSAFVTDIAKRLRENGISCKVDDSSSGIGRRYARNDELGTSFGITIDFQTTQDNTVTLRERDSTEQIRANIDDIVGIVKALVGEHKVWKDILECYPKVTVKE
jgi:glycyl-tRNA synthetase